MAHSLPLEVADKLFPPAHGKNPWKVPLTHMSQVTSGGEPTTVIAASGSLIDVFSNHTPANFLRRHAAYYGIEDVEAYIRERNIP